MIRLSKTDVINALITGLTAGLLAWGVLTYLQSSLPFGFAPEWLVLVIPLCWLAGIQFSYALGRWIGFFNQFGKYVAIGFTNFAVDAGIFNFLLSLSHVQDGPWYIVQKAASFVVAVTHSYYWNRHWAFQSAQQDRRAEFTKFIIVNLIAMVVNVGVAFSVIHFIARPDSLSADVWANIGAIAGSGAALIFSFVGFRIVVFK